MNQMQAVKTHLLDNRPITSMQAFELYGCTRLADKIFRLRKFGMNIVTVEKECVNRYGDTCRYAEYRLVEDENV